MMIEREDRDDGIVLRIERAMSVGEIAAIHKEITACFDECEDLTLDLTGVNDCDISGLQLLYSARKTARSVGKAFSVDNPSESIIEIFNRAGLDPETVLARKSKTQIPKNDKEVSNGQGHHDG
jgi:anti-anti-sigma factor